MKHIPKMTYSNSQLHGKNVHMCNYLKLRVAYAIISCCIQQNLMGVFISSHPNIPLLFSRVLHLQSIVPSESTPRRRTQLQTCIIPPDPASAAVEIVSPLFLRPDRFRTILVFQFLLFQTSFVISNHWMLRGLPDKSLYYAISLGETNT